MTRLELRTYKGRFNDPRVIQIIRRRIRGRLMGGSVLVDMEGSDVTREQAVAIMGDWDLHTVRFCGCIHSLPHPLPERGNTNEANDPRKTRNPRANQTKIDPNKAP